MFRVLILIMVALFIAAVGCDAGEGSSSSRQVSQSTEKVSSTVLEQGQSAKALYDELKKFRRSDEFKHYGFAVNGPFNGWMKRARALDNRTGMEFLAYYGFTPGDIIILGLSYVDGDGSQKVEDRIFKGLRDAGQ